MEQDSAPAGTSGRGEPWFVAQLVLFALIGAAPFVPGGFAPWSPELAGPARWAGVALGLAGLVVAVVAVLQLGTNLTPFPRPKDDGTLVQGGIYAVVRHPIYSGITLGALGWALLFASTAALLLAGGLVVFFFLKSQREEQWLVARYPEYAGYRRRVRRLIPFVW